MGVDGRRWLGAEGGLCCIGDKLSVDVSRWKSITLQRGPEGYDLQATNPSTARPGRRYLVANILRGNYVDYYEMSVQLNAID